MINGPTRKELKSQSQRASRMEQKKTKWFNRTSENPNLCLNRSQSAEDEELVDYTFYHFNIQSSKYKLVT